MNEFVSEQLALAMNELRQTKEDIETYKHRYEGKHEHNLRQRKILKPTRTNIKVDINIT